MNACYFAINKATKSDDELQFVIPIEVHGDDASAQSRQTFRIQTVSSATAMYAFGSKGPTLDTRFLNLT
jgi:hypothetical protein